jgi:hypothetical protein
MVVGVAVAVVGSALDNRVLGSRATVLVPALAAKGESNCWDHLR